MNYQCKNCGGNVVYDPASGKMLCPYCSGYDTEEIKGDRSLTVCSSCGGEVPAGKMTSATKCPFCGNFIIFDERVEGSFKPDRILPFKLSKDMAVNAMKIEFKSRTFLPTSFLTEGTLGNFKGCYVPFFFYDYDAQGEYSGEGTKSRSWRSGNYRYTETSYYRFDRKFGCVYDDIPVDASVGMEDNTMDLMEPYDYAKLMEFDPKFLSGFFSEVYNTTPDLLETRALSKAKQSAESILTTSVSGLSITRVDKKEVNLKRRKIEYVLLPVWIYDYSYGDKLYKFFVNGQSGKVVGETPVSKKKLLSYALSLGAILWCIVKMIFKLLEVM